MSEISFRVSVDSAFVLAARAMKLKGDDVIYITFLKVSNKLRHSESLMN
jgi:hypothetical protein